MSLLAWQALWLLAAATCGLAQAEKTAARQDVKQQLLEFGLYAGVLLRWRLSVSTARVYADARTARISLLTRQDAASCFSSW